MTDKALARMIDTDIDYQEHERDVCEFCNGTHYINPTPSNMKVICPECSFD